MVVRDEVGRQITKSGDPYMGAGGNSLTVASNLNYKNLIVLIMPFRRKMTEIRFYSVRRRRKLERSVCRSHRSLSRERSPLSQFTCRGSVWGVGSANCRTGKWQSPG